MPKVIISDTSCLISLSNIGRLDILHDVFGEVFITEVVVQEFGYPLPTWFKIMSVDNMAKMNLLEKQLDKGEASVIALALEYPDCLLIIDEIKGRKIAKSNNLEIIGTIGVLILAEKRGIVDNPVEISAELIQNGFRLSSKIFNKLKQLYSKN
jgi:hypothetical protein